jgi:hypothetical protein
LKENKALAKKLEADIRKKLGIEAPEPAKEPERRAEPKPEKAGKGK